MATWQNLFQCGGAQVHVRKTIEKFFALATMTSQALKYDVIIYTPYEGLNYPILRQNYITMNTYR